MLRQFLPESHHILFVLQEYSGALLNGLAQIEARGDRERGVGIYVHRRPVHGAPALHLSLLDLKFSLVMGWSPGL